MAEPPVVTSPLASVPATAIRVPDLDLAERPSLGKIVLRGDAADKGFVTAAGQALGLALPARPGAAAGHRRMAILCLAPDEWLAVSEAGALDLVVRLREALAGRHAAVVDVSCATATIAASGRRAPPLLRKICAVDLGRQTSSGRCCWQTRIGPYAVLIHRWNAAESFDLHVARSYARSFWHWLNDAAIEFGS